MAGRHDAGTLLGALRQLDAAEALALLRYLRVLLRNYATLIGGRGGVGRGGYGSAESRAFRFGYHQPLVERL